MIRFLKLLAFIGFAVASILYYSCSNNEFSEDSVKTPKNIAENKNDQKFNRFGERDAQFVVDIYYRGLYQIEFAKYGKLITKKHEVIDLANSVITSYTVINVALKELALKKRINLPDFLSKEEVNEIHRNAEKHETDFDQFFAEKLVEDYTMEIDFIRKASFEGNDVELSNFFTAVETELKEHLTMAMKIREFLK